MTRRWAHVVVDLPELNMGIFAFLLSFPWEILQSPFYQGFTGLGLAVTILVEILATQVWHRWRYSDLMPTIPLLEVGLIPLLMWGVLPPLILWVVRRQLRG
jgi:hypothetical protein